MRKITFKSTAVFLLLLSLSMNFILYKDKLDSLESFKEQEQVLKIKMYELEEEMLEHIDESKSYKTDMESFKFIFDALFEYEYDRNVEEVLEDTYTFEINIACGDKELKVPPSGIVHITDNAFAFNARVEKPPLLANQRVNDLLDYYNLDLFRSLYYPTPDDFKIEESLLHLEYDNLEIGDRIQLVPTQRFKDKYGLISDVIEIHVVEEDFYNGSDYFPSKPTIATYRHSGLDQILVYDYHTFEGDYIDITITREDFARDVSFDISDGAISPYIREGEYIGLHMNSPILPSTLIVGRNWLNGDFTRVVTDLDVDVSTPAGDFNCIEISTFSHYGEGNKDYYSKGVGLVKTVSNNYTNELIKIEDSDNESIQVQNEITLLSEEEVDRIYQKALEIHFWFEVGTLQADIKDEVVVEDRKYYKVGKFTKYQELVDMMESVLDYRIVANLLSSNTYISVGGDLYGVIADRGTNIYKGAESYEIIRKNNKEIIYKVKVEVLDNEGKVNDYEVYDFNLKFYNDRKWRFEEFYLIR